ncbi:OSM3-like kinesin, partial [Trypanosoma cruzi]
VSEESVQAQIDSVRKEYEARERELLAAMKLDENSGDGKAVLALLNKNASGGGAVSEAAQKEIESLRSDLEEERVKCEKLVQSKEAQQVELKALRQEVAESESRYVDLEGKMNEMVSDYERQLANAHGSTEKIADLTARLKERTDQLDQMRGLLEKQKALIVKSNEKCEYLQQKLREVNARAERTEEIYRQKLQERDENFQSVLNQRLEEYARDHHDDVTKQEEKSKKLRKKIKKIENEVDRLKEEYDCKVCECEDLRNTIEEQ